MTAWPRARTARLVLSATVVVSAATVAVSGTEPFAFLQTGSEAQRREYLASARIWQDPGALTPADVLAGPARPAIIPPARNGAAPALSCRFARPGATLGGATPKFQCRTADDVSLRVKYTDGTRGGNREVYALVAATRLLWALGFGADPIYPITVTCEDCPENPMTGAGPRASRQYLAIYQPTIADVVMVSGSDPNAGWSWADLDTAIDALPAGPQRDRQRAHFDALTLAAVVLQHGDRKPEQQRLACGGPVDPAAGDIHPLAHDDGHGYRPPVFFERPGARACADPVVTVQDVGATFGGAGRTSNARTAKMNLPVWATHQVFLPATARRGGGPAECRGNLTVSLSARGWARQPAGERGRTAVLPRPGGTTDRCPCARRDAGRPRRPDRRFGLARPAHGRVVDRRGRVGGGLARQDGADRRADLRALTRPADV